MMSKLSTRNPIAFVFRTEGFSKLGFDKAIWHVINVASGCSKRELVTARFGLIPIYQYVYRLTGLTTSKIGTTLAGGESFAPDNALFGTFIGQLVASAETMDHVFVPAKFAQGMLENHVECISVDTICPRCRKSLHDTFTSETATYLGYFEVDRGDPLTLNLAANHLIPHCRYGDRVLSRFQEYDIDENHFWSVRWTAGLDLDLVEFTFEDPPLVMPAPLTTEGLRSRTLLENRASPEHSERVLAALRDTTDQTIGSDIALTEQQRREPTIKQAKLTEYALNEQHMNRDGTPGKGRHKAAAFKAALGIDRENWGMLAEQLLAGERSARMERPRVTEYGIQYELTIPVTGENGNTKDVTSAWIVRTGEAPSLVTAYLGKNADTEDHGPLAGLILNGARTDEYWKKLYAIGHEEGTKAAHAWSPNPMIVGDGVYTDGMCGFAWLTLPDGRAPFARWLRKNEIGYRGHPRGWTIMADIKTQSVEREQKYISAFAQVLRLNGFQCTTHWRYD